MEKKKKNTKNLNGWFGAGSTMGKAQLGDEVIHVPGTYRKEF